MTGCFRFHRRADPVLGYQAAGQAGGHAGAPAPREPGQPDVWRRLSCSVRCPDFFSQRPVLTPLQGFFFKDLPGNASPDPLFQGGGVLGAQQRGFPQEADLIPTFGLHFKGRAGIGPGDKMVVPVNLSPLLCWVA